MLKATTIDKFGRESYPVSLEVNESGYVLLHDDPDAIQWNLYAPFWEEKEIGPWYLIRCYCRRDVLHSRRTVVGEYRHHDLRPHLCPQEPCLKIPMPPPMPDQMWWAVYGGHDPKPPASIWVQVNQPRG